ncbi:MAG: hypothetical protein KKE11_06165, partial [Gammaproteobacteria bacterium]|nr:hypothetical protein [Gammaproteobacteria bacterium]
MNIIKNINELARKSQKKTIILVLAFIGVLVFFGWSFGPSKLTKATEEHDRSFAKMDGTTDSQFTQDASQKVLEEQHREIKDLNEQLKGFGDQLDFLQKTLDEKNVADIGNSQELVQNLQVRIEELEDALHKKSSGQSNTGLVNGVGEEPAARGITTISFSYEDEARGTIETQK